MTPRPFAPAIPVPVDAALPGLAGLLDVSWFLGAAGALAAGGAAAVSCRPVYVRYKPGTNAVAVHELAFADGRAPLLVQGKCLAAADWDNARDKAVATDWATPATGAPLALCPDERILLLAFPNDPALDGLRFAAHAKRMQRAIYAHCDFLPEAEWRVSDRRLELTPVRFKPEKRAVVRLDTRAVHRLTGERRPLRLYARVDADGRGRHDLAVLTHIQAHLAAHAVVGAPRPLTYDADHHLLLVADAGGASCAGIANAGAMGLALAALHALPAPTLPMRPFAAHLDDARDTARTVAALDTALAAPAARLLEALMNRAHDAGTPSVVTHGDCHPGQVLVDGPRIVLLDFDRCHLGDAAADLGNYLAHADAAILAGGPVEPTEARLLQAYGEGGGRRPDAARLALWRALGLLQLAASPFRALDPKWPVRAAAILERGREVLACN